MNCENLVTEYTNNSDPFSNKERYLLRKYGEFIIIRTERCDYKFISLNVFLDRDEYDKSKSRYKYLISKYKFWKNIITQINKIEISSRFTLTVFEVLFHSSYNNLIKNQIKILSEWRSKIRIYKL